MSRVPLLSFLSEMGLMMPEMGFFSITFGFSLVSCFSSSDSRTIKCGNAEGKVSLSESQSGYERLEDFDAVIKEFKFSSVVLPTDLGAQQGDVQRGNPFAPETSGLHN